MQRHPCNDMPRQTILGQRVVDCTRVVAAGRADDLRQRCEMLHREFGFDRQRVRRWQHYRMLVFKQTNAFESVAPFGQSSQSKFHGSTIELIQHMLHAHGSDVQYNRGVPTSRPAE